MQAIVNFVGAGCDWTAAGRRAEAKSVRRVIIRDARFRGAATEVGNALRDQISRSFRKCVVVGNTQSGVPVWGPVRAMLLWLVGAGSGRHKIHYVKLRRPDIKVAEAVSMFLAVRKSDDLVFLL